MTDRLVVDNSVAVKMFFPEEFAAQALSLLVGDYELHAPTLILSEFGNVVWRRVRAGVITLSEAYGLVSDFTHVPIIRHDGATLLDDAMKLAVDYDRSFYDATYLALAVRLDAKLVPADARLLNAVSPGLSERVAWIGNFDALDPNRPPPPS